jgi:phosphoadenosine phosphosulfate reductase
MSLEKKMAKSKKIIVKAVEQYPKNKLAIAWTGGKDSTVLLHLIKQIYGKVPFPVFFNDSTMEFKEVYQFIDRLTQDWSLKLIKVTHLPKPLAEFHRLKDHKKKKKLSRLMKISAIDFAVKKYHWLGFLAAIRWDEHSSRAKEKYFSKRKDHIRIHPLLHFTEKDIWDYIKKFNVPYVSLYDQGYRSLGEAPFTSPAKKGKGERSGREKDKELIMSRLRALGYW